MGYTSGGGGYYIPKPYKKPVQQPFRTGQRTTTSVPNRVLQSTGPQGPGGPVPSAGGYQYTGMLRQGLANQAKQPGGGTTWWTANLTPGQLADLTLDPNRFNQAYQAFNAPGEAPQDMGFPPGYPGGPGGGGGGGGGGGAAGPQGLDQATFDYLSGILGRGKPQALTAEELDLPDPSQYMKWDNTLYNTARQGVATGIEGIRGRGNTAFDQAQGELSRYQNPYEGGLQTRNPDLQAAMSRMMQANNVNPGQVGATANEGVQADRAMANSLAMLAGTDQARQAANMRALQGDRTTFGQNLDIEGNMLNLGVNMGEARGKSAFDQRLQDAQYQALQQEAMNNWQRRGQVADTNVGNQNQWNQDVLNKYMELIGMKAPEVALPAAGTVPWA